MKRQHAIAGLVLVLILVALACGCDVDGDVGPERPGLEAFNGVRMELPAGPRSAFRERFPGATMRTWNEVVTDRGTTAHYVVFEKADGSVEDIWIMPEGEPIPPLIDRPELGEGTD